MRHRRIKKEGFEASYRQWLADQSKPIDGGRVSRQQRM